MNYEEAKRLYGEAIRIMTSEGLGSQKAFAMLLESANAGYIDAISMVGKSYRDGSGVTKNSTEALKWFTLAADQGNESGIACLDDVYQDIYGDDWEDYYVPVMERYAQMGFQEAIDTLARKRQYGLIGGKSKYEYEKRLRDMANATQKSAIFTIIAVAGFILGSFSGEGAVLLIAIIFAVICGYSAGHARKYIHHTKFKRPDRCTKYKAGDSVNGDHYWFPTSKDRRAYIKALSDAASKARR
jgi:FOG: TPR repeat, SEL1 subfamily